MLVAGCDSAMGQGCVWHFSIPKVSGWVAEDPRVPLVPVEEHTDVEWAIRNLGLFSEMGNLIKDSNCYPSTVLPPRSPHGNSGLRAVLLTGPRGPSADQAPPASSITLRTCKLLFIPTSHLLLKNVGAS